MKIRYRTMMAQLECGLALLLVYVLLSVSGCSGEEDDDASSISTPTPLTEPGLMTVDWPVEGQIVTGSSLELWIRLASQADPTSIQVQIDGMDVSGALQYVADPPQLRGEGIALESGEHVLEASVRSSTGGIQRTMLHFSGRPGGAQAEVIVDSGQLIGGGATLGRLGDYLLSNGRVRFVVSDIGRPFLGIGAFGGNLIDADLVRPPWEPGQDQMGAFAVGLNLEDTLNATSIEVTADGADGGPVIVEARGPDDLIPTFNVSSIATLFTPLAITDVPPSANDVDLPIGLVNRYILEPGADSLTWETDIHNESSSPISFYYGDYVSMTGNVEFFSAGMGFGTVDIRPTLDWMAYLNYDNPGGYAVGYIPEIHDGSSLVSLQGVHYPFLGQAALEVLLDAAPPVFTVAGGETLTIRRWIAVGRDAGAVNDVRIARLGLESGTVGGTVTRGGLPAKGARVAALVAGKGSSGVQVLDHWVTDAQGHWGGRLEPGSYTIEASLEGSAWPGGGAAPPSRSVNLVAGGTQSVDFAFDPSASLRVQVSDETGAPVPAKVTVVGFDPSPDPVEIDAKLARTVHGEFSDPDRDPMPFGLVAVAFAGTDGQSGALEIEPGEYAVVVSRGQEYSLFQQRVTLVAGQLLEIDARIARVVETPGFAAGDFHVHSIDSFDAPIPREQRAKSLLAEGLDMFAATDHTIRVDYSGVVAALGGSDLLAAFVGEEITTFDIGHYNLYPVTADSSQVNFGAVDWAGDAPAGTGFPSAGVYNLSPSQLSQLVAKTPGPHVFQLNHLNNPVHGFFSLTGIDTATTPPHSVMPPTLFRQDPSISNLWADGWTAMEIWRGYVDEESLIFRENLGDYFNLLNQGIVRTITSDSDTHSSRDVPTGGPRNYVGLGDMTGPALAASGEALAGAINAGRVICSNGPFLEVELETSQGVASHRPGLPMLVEAAEGSATLHITVTAPAWARFDEIEVYYNNAPYPMLDDDDGPGRASYQGVDLSGVDVPRYEVAPQVRLVAGVDFDVDEVSVYPAIAGAVRLEATVSVVLSGLKEDTWVVVAAKGTEGVSPPLFPVIPAGIDPDTNPTLDDLLDGNVGQGGIMALAIANALFLDVDGNGKYDAPGVRLGDAPAGGEEVRGIATMKLMAPLPSSLHRPPHRAGQSGRADRARASARSGRSAG